MSITVYMKPSCIQCNATLEALDAHGLQYELVDVSEDTDALNVIKALGYTQAPVVVTPFDDHWSGIRSDLIDELAEGMQFEAGVHALIVRKHARRISTIDRNQITRGCESHA